MRVLHYPEKLATEGTVVAIGNFDGVHKGHLALLGQARQLAQRDGLAFAVVTFHPHPKSVFGRVDDFKLMISFERRLELLEKAGADVVYVIPFSLEYAQTPPAAFINETLLKALKARHVVVGENFHFGYKASGDVVLLAECRAFETHAVAPVICETGEVVSSTRIRQLLKAGEHEAALALLGRKAL